MSARAIRSAANISGNGVPAGLTFALGPEENFRSQALEIIPTSGTISTINGAIEVSLDGTNYFPVGTAITAATGGVSQAPIPHSWPYVRANITNATGTFTATVILAVSN